MGFLETAGDPPEYDSDEAVLSASIKQPDLFAILVDRYQEAFMRAAFSIVRQKEEAEDIVQEAFTKMYLHAGSFQKQEHAGFKSWAYRIVINSGISRYRKLKKVFDTQAPLDQEIYVNLPAERNEREDTESRILTDELLNELPQDLRRALEAYYLEGKPYKIIAAEEDVPLSTLKMRLFRAKKTLKGLIQ